MSGTRIFSYQFLCVVHPRLWCGCIMLELLSFIGYWTIRKLCGKYTNCFVFPWDVADHFYLVWEDKFRWKNVSAFCSFHNWRNFRLFCSQCSFDSNVPQQQNVWSWHGHKKTACSYASIRSKPCIKSHTTRCPKFFSGTFPGGFPMYTCKLYKYDVFTYAAAQILIPYVAGFDIMYGHIGYLPRNAHHMQNWVHQHKQGNESSWT